MGQDSEAPLLLYLLYIQWVLCDVQLYGTAADSVCTYTIFWVAGRGKVCEGERLGYTFVCCGGGMPYLGVGTGCVRCEGGGERPGIG